MSDIEIHDEQGLEAAEQEIAALGHQEDEAARQRILDLKAAVLAYRTRNRQDLEKAYPPDEVT